MKYSFFGTCSKDYFHFFECLETMANQSLLPQEIILVDSGNKNIKKDILNYLNLLPINLIYIKKEISRIKGLNLALAKSSSEYSFRFDTRARFSRNYAKEAITVLRDKSLNISVAGGVPVINSEGNSFAANLCAGIMQRKYIFFYPKHRNLNYSGYASSVYLGCFKTKFLKKIKYRETQNLISEDSLIIKDFSDNGYRTYIDSKIKIAYVARSSFFNILRLFNTYGFCRLNTIFLSKKMFLSTRHILVFIIIILLISTLIAINFYFILFSPILLLIFNLISEVLESKSKTSKLIPLCATLCQLSWIMGFCWALMNLLKKKNSQTNFIS
jgi:hypothetical protein